jgi:hypothetical protein
LIHSGGESTDADWVLRQLAKAILSLLAGWS